MRLHRHVQRQRIHRTGRGTNHQVRVELRERHKVVTTSPETGESYNAGSYIVVLTVTDAAGATAKASRAISGGSGSLGCT
jgi:hypothetical protein